jgi:hypothetical protein
MRGARGGTSGLTRILHRLARAPRMCANACVLKNTIAPRLQKLTKIKIRG